MYPYKNQNMNTEFIEVIGEGKYQEKIENYVLELKIEARAADEEKAMKAVFSLRDEAVKKLKHAGLSSDNIIDGGHELWKPWYSRKKSGRYTYYKLILEVADENLLSKSVEHVTVLFQDHQRYSLTYDMKQPKYENPTDLEKQAIKDAFNNAMLKANAIADSSNLAIGKLLQATELSKSKRNAGAYGDEDWMGDASRFGGAMATGGMVEEDDTAMKKAERTIWVRYKFRFETSQTR